ncbi:quinone-dependent dihydroorotate dehydrogenase [Sphingomonas oligophenolica]|uniref:Dihydroorotate dehydrogenase (quinone) n=1 Tax=Sphingomonas oligophenolica TaxID=301154 RepID=A0A502CLC6_9SPHN|nr:quinone-dependent dihydroorotate dehydrogenase [Sphingomonas oligophenolica]TPG14465.1 quinone-dependent dihydroorotate dehydrogenase [Sphingomonas oligophenolica]
MAFYHPLLFRLDAERAHRMTVAALGAWARVGAPLGSIETSPRLATTVAGLAFANPVGLAAGVDKDARAIPGWFGLGFGSVEVGTLTPLPQSGNLQPRLFRLVEDRAVINRMGFNNGGLAAALNQLCSPAKAGAQAGSPPSRGYKGILGINVGANRDTADRTADYVHGVTAAAAHADYITINISSPNTPGLRDLQHGAALRDLLAACIAARGTTPLFLKVAPDLDPAAIDDIARAAIDHHIDALIVGNTTISRPALASANRDQAGGLSGAPLAALARQRLADFRTATGGTIPLIAVGGIDSGAEAYARIRSGASLIQLYTALVYEGPGLARRIARDLDALLERDGFATVADAVSA